MDAGPSPTISAGGPGPVVISSGVIEKRPATPAGRSDCGDRNVTSTGTVQTSVTCPAGSSGSVHTGSSSGEPRLTAVTSPPNLAASMSVLAPSDGHVACVSGDSSSHCASYRPAANWSANIRASAMTAGGATSGPIGATDGVGEGDVATLGGVVVQLQTTTAAASATTTTP